MLRPIVAGLFVVGVVLAAGIPCAPARDTKSQPKKKQRIAIADPKEAAKDPDFAIQGEYEGTLTEENKKEEKVGVQVVARGLGEFTVKALKGGLPGAGWDGKNSESFTASRRDSGVVIRAANKEIGTIADDKIEIKHNRGTLTAKRVERKSKTLGEKPTHGAVVLFGGPEDVNKWNGGKIVNAVRRQVPGRGREEQGEVRRLQGAHRVPPAVDAEQHAARAAATAASIFRIATSVRCSTASA